MSFVDLGLKPELLRAVNEKGYSEPTPIQAQAIPAVLAGGDVLAGAQTGTGKTAAFVLPILQRLDRAGGRTPRALVLTPTRELAAQVAESASVYGKYVGLRTLVVFGGVSINPQIDSLQDRCDLLVATPGRLLDLAEQGALDLRAVQCFVLDEADRMLDMGFIHAIRRILKLLPPQRQNLMFSATYSDDIRALAARFLRNPTNIEVAARNATADRVDQQIYRVPKEHKRHLLAHLIDEGNWHQVLVFTRTKHGANRLAQQLESYGVRAAAIHGNKSQGARVRALSDFKAYKITALVATEVAARGLDIKELPHVVNYELPNVPEDYVHRIGRTARAGGTGSAVSLVSPDEAPLLKDIERMLKRALPVAALPKFPIVTGPVGDARGHRASAGREVEHAVAAVEDGQPMRHEDSRGEGRRPVRHGDQRGEGRRPMRHGDQRGEGRRPMRQGDQRGEGGRPMRHGDQRSQDQQPARHSERVIGEAQQPARNDSHRGEGRNFGLHGDQRGRPGQYSGGGQHTGRPSGGGQHSGRHSGGGQHSGRQSGGGQHSGRHSGAGRHAGGESGQGRGDFRRGRSGQPSRQFSSGNGEQRRREGGGRPGGRR